MSCLRLINVSDGAAVLSNIRVRIAGTSEYDGSGRAGLFQAIAACFLSPRLGPWHRHEEHTPANGNRPRGLIFITIISDDWHQGQGRFDLPLNRCTLVSACSSRDRASGWVGAVIWETMNQKV